MDGGGIDLGFEILAGDCLAVMREMPDDSVDLIATDPPYFKVKKEAWDRQWDKPEVFLEWIGALCDEWRRVLKPNGSLYVFASPKMAWGVEGQIRDRFEVLNRIRWVKKAGRHQKVKKETLRRFFPACEEIIFAEQRGSDSLAMGEVGYAAQCEKTSRRGVRAVAGVS